MKRFSSLLSLVAIFLLVVFTAAASARPVWQDTSVEVADQELQIKRFDAKGEHLIIWLAPGYGVPDREYAMAAALAKRGVEVWHLDLLESLFLPRSTNALRALDGHYLADLIVVAHEKTGKQITLLTRAYGSLPVLRGARLWQRDYYAQDDPAQQGSYFSGAILFSPELHSHTVELGLDPVYDPIAAASNIPIMLYQSGKRSNRWQLTRTMAEFETGGAQVFLKLLPGVTGLFYDEDISAETLKTLKQLPDELVSVLNTLKKSSMPKTVLALADSAPVAEGGRDIKLLPFRGKSVPAALKLIDSQGRAVQRDSYLGKVTVVNFWASWCGPCVEEIPSLNNLRETMQGRAFELISVNYAEDKNVIREFLNKVKVDFPVLLDSDGRVAAEWNVLVFPATFVIGPDGRIHYGVNGGIYWDSPDVIEKLEKLMQSPG